MRSIERRFQVIKSKSDPCVSSFMCFVKAIEGQKMTFKTMCRWFYKLVDPTDYDKKDKKEILQDLESLLKVAEDDKKQG